MFSMKAFRYVLLFWNSVIMGTSLVFLITLFVFHGTIEFPSIIGLILIAIGVSFVAGLLIPMNRMADKFASVFKAKQGSVLYTLTSTVVYSLIYSLIFLLLFVAMFTGFSTNYFQIVFGAFPLTLLISYVVGVITSPIAYKIACSMCAKKSVNENECAIDG